MQFNLADIILFILIAVFMFLGLRAGFKKSLVSFVCLAVSLLLSVLLAPVATRALMGIDSIANLIAGPNNSIFTFFYNHLWAGLDQISIEYLNQVYSYGGATAVDAVFMDGGFNLSSVFMMIVYPLVRSAAVSPIMLNSTMDTARHLFALELAYGASVFIVGILLFLILRIIAACLNIAFKFSGKKGAKKNPVSRLVGGAIGLLRGAVYAGLILIVLSLLAGFAFMDTPMQTISNSFIAGHISNGANAITEFIIRSNPESTRFEILLKAAGFY
ncbi:MAG: hypothetical protein FWE03_07055 [Firmicutes bacterium]|nr:hypothetical protein [Bacillota bacterium]